MDKQVYISLLKQLISMPSISGQENETAALLHNYFTQKGYTIERIHNNLIVRNKNYDSSKETIVLNSHHDTAKPNTTWTYPPHHATTKGDKLIGLGSNDAGASLVSLIAVFDHFYAKSISKNLILIASSEEENSGDKGIRSVLPQMNDPIHLAIIGEPTEMNIAIAEKGLLVIDAKAHGESGHAARPNGKNAIDIAVDDIQRIHRLKFEKVSKTLGPVIKSVTQINAGTQHNVIPDLCHFVIDVRINEMYLLEEVFEALQNVCTSELVARSFKNRPSGTPPSHPIRKVIQQLNIPTFGSPTLSDQAHFNCPSIKMGPGKSERSHQADEFILISEIESGIDQYIHFLSHYINEL